MTKRQLKSLIAKTIESVVKNPSIEDKVKALKTAAHTLALALKVSNDEAEAMYFSVMNELKEAYGW